jgi:hypothetical protein
MRRLLVLGALMTLIPAGAAAQVCNGQPALTDSNMGSVGMGASFFEQGRTIGADAVFGGPFFGFGAFRFTDYDGTDLSQTSVGGGIGYNFEETGGVSICPMLGASYGFGLSMPWLVESELVEADVTDVRIVPALGIGLATELSSNVTVAPFAQGAVVYTRRTRDAQDISKETTEDTSGMVSLGVALILNDMLSVAPTVSVPVARDIEAEETSFGLFLSVGLGRW